MGKSDPFILKFYEKSLSKIGNVNSVAFFGQSEENFISLKVNSGVRDFYDLSLGNWDINQYPYNICDEKYDAIIITRCAYFCKKPDRMLSEFNRILKPKGRILIDWGLGDHWRFKNFKVGWCKDGEQEFAYTDNNFLWSCFYDEKIQTPCMLNFQKHVEVFGYDNLENAIFDEVPSILNLESFDKAGFQVKVYDDLFLWPEAPQLYTCFVLEKT